MPIGTAIGLKRHGECNYSFQGSPKTRDSTLISVVFDYFCTTPLPTQPLAVLGASYPHNILIHVAPEKRLISFTHYAFGRRLGRSFL